MENHSTHFFFILESNNEIGYSIQHFTSREDAETAMQTQLQEDIAAIKATYGFEPTIHTVSPDKIQLIFDSIIASSEDFTVNTTYRIYEYHGNL